MISNWSKFNEDVTSDINLSVQDKLRKSLSEKIRDIRDIFIDFADGGLIERYSSEVSQNHIRCTNGDFDGFVESIMFSMKPKDLYAFHDGSKNMQIEVNIYIPGERSVGSGNAILTSSSIPILEDIIVTMKRLESFGFQAKLDLNSAHKEFKPVVFIITFNL